MSLLDLGVWFNQALFALNLNLFLSPKRGIVPMRFQYRFSFFSFLGGSGTRVKGLFVPAINLVPDSASQES